MGGKEDDPDMDEAACFGANKHKPRDKETEEPFLFHTIPHTAFEELIHGMDVVAVIALSADGKAALAALEKRIPFFGLSFTPEHSMWLTKRLEGQVFRKMQDGMSKLHQPGLTTLIGAAPPEKEEKKKVTTGAKRGATTTTEGTRVPKHPHVLRLSRPSLHQNAPCHIR